MEVQEIDLIYVASQQLIRDEAPDLTLALNYCIRFH